MFSGQHGSNNEAMKLNHVVRNIICSAATVAVLSAVITPEASAEDMLKLAMAQRGAWESAAPELGQSAGIFKKHGIALDLLQTRDGEVESSVASGSTDVGMPVGTVGVLRAYAKGAPLRVIGANTTGTANYWYVQAASLIKTVKDINGKTIAYWTGSASSKYDVFDLIKQYRLKARPTAIGGAAATFKEVMSGHVDVGWAEAPFGVDAIEQGKIRVVARAADIPAIRRDTVRVVITNADTLQNRKDVLARFMQAYRETINWMYSDPAALKRYAELAGVSEGVAQRLRDEFFTKDMLSPDKVVGLDAIMKEAITSRNLQTPLSKAQVAELVQIPAPVR
jgi:NitT/TauT family transport system substrate-binding protein